MAYTSQSTKVVLVARWLQLGRCDSVDAPHPIGRNRVRAQSKGKGTTTSSSNAPGRKKDMAKGLYKASEKLNYANLYNSFTKLMDNTPTT
jgi:hypothetical protein